MTGLNILLGSYSTGVSKYTVLVVLSVDVRQRAKFADDDAVDCTTPYPGPVAQSRICHNQFGCGSVADARMMSSKGKSGRPHPSQDKSSWLLNDARQMEERLANLRSQMEKEHIERQRRLASGRVWTSSDAPRTRIGKQQISGRGNITLESSLRQAAVNRVALLGSQTQGRGSLPPLSQGVEHDDKRREEGCRAQEQSSDTYMYGCNSVNKEPAFLATGKFNEEESRQSFLAALDAWRAKPMLELANQRNAVDTAVVTDAHPGHNGHGPDAPRHMSVFKRMILLKATEKAGNAAAAVCPCRYADSVIHHSDEHVPASSCSVACAMHLESSEPAVSSSCAAHAKCGTTVDNSTCSGPCPDYMQYEGVRVISVTDVEPHLALTSKSRLPDSIILPH